MAATPPSVYRVTAHMHAAGLLHTLSASVFESILFSKETTSPIFTLRLQSFYSTVVSYILKNGKVLCKPPQSSPFQSDPGWNSPSKLLKNT